MPEKTAKAKKAVQPTPYVVLIHLPIKPATKFDDAFELPKDWPAEPLYAALQAGAWLPIGTATTRTKKAAIEEVVGERSGAYKAIAASSWRGGVTRAQRSIWESVPLEEASV